MLVHPVSFLIFRWGLWSVDLWLPLQASQRGFKLPSWRRGCSLPPTSGALPPHWNPGVARSPKKPGSSCRWLPTTFNAQIGALQCTGPSLTHCAVAQVWVFLSPGGPSLEAIGSLLSPCPALHASFPRRDF